MKPTAPQPLIVRSRLALSRVTLVGTDLIPHGRLKTGPVPHGRPNANDQPYQQKGLGARRGEHHQTPSGHSKGRR